jgi:pyruvate dehydrogenase E1 component beta subunit
MAIEIKMPALSPTMEEGTLAKWLVADGDDVRSGDVIAEIETDKATMEVEAIEDGKIGQILVPAGTQHVKVNAVIAMLLEDGESASDMKLPTPDAPAEPVAAPVADDTNPSAKQHQWRKQWQPRWQKPNGQAVRRRLLFASHFVMRWPKKCAAMKMSLSWVKKLPNIRVPIR